MIFPDPWDSIPQHRRLDWAIVAGSFESLSTATELNVERQIPGHIANVPGAPPLLLLMTRVAQTSFATLRYFCGESPADPARSLAYASSAPPLLRSLYWTRSSRSLSSPRTSPPASAGI